MTSGVFAVNGISITKIYGTGPSGVTALNDVSIAIKDNDFLPCSAPRVVARSHCCAVLPDLSN